MPDCWRAHEAQQAVGDGGHALHLVVQPVHGLGQDLARVSGCRASPSSARVSSTRPAMVSITARGLLISWATPEAIWPTAARRSERIRSFFSRSRVVMSRQRQTTSSGLPSGPSIRVRLMLQMTGRGVLAAELGLVAGGVAVAQGLGEELVEVAGVGAEPVGRGADHLVPREAQHRFGAAVEGQQVALRDRSGRSCRGCSPGPRAGTSGSR